MLKRIAHITDTHIDDPTALDRGIDPRNNLHAILEHIADIGIDEIVFTGDIGMPGTYNWVFEQLSRYSPAFKITLGNHDELPEALQHYSNTKSAGKDGLYYAHEDDVYKYIYMDSSAGEISDVQLQWLEAEATTLKKVILFIHHPILGFETGMDKTYPLQNRDSVNEILQQCKQEVTVFCGHYHMPDKRTDRKVTQYITPAVSFQVKKHSPVIDINVASFGYRIITLTSDSVKSTLVTSRYDYFSPKI
jgi:Icc protein